MSYILLPNNFFNDGHKQQLNYNELYLYVFLHMARTRWNDLVLTNLDILTSYIKLQKNKQKNQTELIKCLISLYRKELISFHIKSHIFNEKVIKEHKNDLKISLNHDKGKGWTRLDYTLWEKSENNPDYFMIMAYINQWSGKRNDISFSEFSKVILQPNGKYIAEKTAKNKIKEMEEKGFINVESGRYYIDNNGQIKQEINQYTILEKQANKEEEEVKMEKQKPQVKNEDEEPIINEKSMVSRRIREGLQGVNNLTDALEWFYKGKGNEKPTYELYELWKESINEKFKKAAGKRFEGLAKKTDFVKKWGVEYENNKKQVALINKEKRVNTVVIMEKKTALVLEDLQVISITKETIDEVDFKTVKEIGYQDREYIFDLDTEVACSRTFDIDYYLKNNNHKKVKTEDVREFIKSILDKKEANKQYLSESDIKTIQSYIHPYYSDDYRYL